MPLTRTTVKVAQGSNVIAVNVQEQSSVTLLRDGVEIVREESGESNPTFVVEPGEYQILTDGQIERVDTDLLDVAAASPVDQEERLLLRLSSDAPDHHEVDGIGEVPADGHSFCTVTAEKLDLAAEPLRRRRDTDEVFLRTTGGTLMDEHGNDRIRAVRLRAGRARFRLVAENAPKL